MDEQGNLRSPAVLAARFTYDARNWIITETHEVDGDTANDLTTTFAYDEHGNLVSEISPRGNRDTFSWDERNLLWGNRP